MLEIGDLKVTGNQIRHYLVKEKKFVRGRTGRLQVTDDALKKRVVENIIIQTLIGKEALARHYEERLPFKEVYDFYRHNRLTIEWKKAVIDPQVVITDLEIADEYEKMETHFRLPDEVDIAWVRTADLVLARKVQQELMEGRDFFRVMVPRFGAGVEMRKQPLDNLSPFMQKIVIGLAPGQESPPVEKMMR